MHPVLTAFAEDAVAAHSSATDSTNYNLRFLMANSERHSEFFVTARWCHMYTTDVAFSVSCELSQPKTEFSSTTVGGRVVRWCWVNFQCRGVLQLGLQ